MDAVCHVSEIRRRGYVMLCYVMYTARIYRQTCLLRALAARGVCKQRTERDLSLIGYNPHGARPSLYARKRRANASHNRLCSAKLRPSNESPVARSYHATRSARNASSPAALSLTGPYLEPISLVLAMWWAIICTRQSRLSFDTEDLQKVLRLKERRCQGLRSNVRTPIRS